MYLTSPEALDLLRAVAQSATEARVEWDRRRALRDELIRALDGQELMFRTAMAEACGITRKALWDIVQVGRPESIEHDDVLLSDALVQLLEEALGDVPADVDGYVRLDVHA